MTSIINPFYTLSDIEDRIFNGINYTLPDNVLEQIAKLNKDLQIPDYVPVVANKKHTYSTGKHIDRKTAGYYSNTPKKVGTIRPNGGRDVTGEQWETLRAFKTTKVINKEGIEKKINTIRILLNQISNKNYDTQQPNIIKEIHSFFEESEDSPDIENNFQKLVKILFDVISCNKFFSDIYSQLYMSLISNFPVFESILIKHIGIFRENLSNINYIDPNKDYDGFCMYTKLNDQRKAMTMFIVNATKNGILDMCHMIAIIQYLLDMSLKYIDEPNRNNELEEITENVFLFVSNCQTMVSDCEEWNEYIMPIVMQISQMKIKDHKSLTNRMVFKYMDIVDSLQK